MGMFDSIMVPCPTCGTRAEFQTKSGECLLYRWNLEDAPPDALGDVNRHSPYQCDKCATTFAVKLEIKATPVVVQAIDKDTEASHFRRRYVEYPSPGEETK